MLSEKKTMTIVLSKSYIGVRRPSHSAQYNLVVSSVWKEALNAGKANEVIRVVGRERHKAQGLNYNYTIKVK